MGSGGLGRWGLGSGQEEEGTGTTYQKKLKEICRRIFKKEISVSLFISRLMLSLLPQMSRPRQDVLITRFSATLPRPLFPLLAETLQDSRVWGGLVRSALGHPRKYRA